VDRVSIEAGGNAPFIVFDDADIDAAVDGAIASKFRQAGQTCVCANRIYVQSDVYADFASKLAEKVDKFKARLPSICDLSLYQVAHDRKQIGNGLDKET